MPLQKGALWFFMLRLLLVCTQEVTEEQSDVTILRQINRLNDDGSYTFGYEAADGSFKIETRDVEGNVKGMFGFVDENGELKRISYSARNGTGFQASGTIATPVENARLNPSYTTVKPPAHHPFLKRPILILKAMVPEVTEDSESEENESENETPRQPYYSEEYSRRSKQGEREFLRNTKPVPFVDSNELTSGRPVLTRKILLGKRPSEDINEKRPRGGSGLRRQLSRGGDTADTRGTGSNGYINGQTPAIPAKLAVLANLMNEFEASSRSYTDSGYASQEQYPKVAYSEPDYVDYADAPTPAPVPVPRQFYPITTPIPPPPTPGYQGRPIINPGPYRNPIYPGIPRDSYNVAYNSLREELMEYILQILQQRLVPGQYGSPLGQYPSQTIAPPPLPYGYDQGYNPLRSYIPSPAYPPQSFLPPRYPLGPGPYLGGRNYPQQPIPVVSPNIQYSEQGVKYPSMEDLTTQSPKVFSSRRLLPRRKFRPSPQVEENYEYTTQGQDLGGNLLTSPTRSAPVRYATGSSTTESSRSKGSQPVRSVQIIESESRVSSSTVPAKSKANSESVSSSSVSSTR
ncbi:hypothetical protein M8J76_012308 [Diaphorina citri]|nr:hypothetical protein M8J76_012308 [Diaphorina citri]